MTSNSPVTLIVIGALHVDEIARSSETMILGESNPVSWTRHAGGVAANVSRAAATRPDLKVHLVANVGTDNDADQLRAVMSDNAVNVISISYAEIPAGRYSAVLQPNGKLLVGLADTAQAEQLTFDTIAERIQPHNATAVFFDGNLSAHTMKELTNRLPKHCSRIGMSVSPAKASRFKACLPTLDILFCNRSEAEAMVQHLDCNMTTMTRPADLVSRLCHTGCKHVVLTDGAHGVYVGSGAEQSYTPVTATQQPVTLNGPGDALAGATIAHLLDHRLTHHTLVSAISLAGIPAANAVLTGQNQAPLLV